MNATLKNLLTVGTVFAIGSGMTLAAFAGPPHDAGFKARGLKERSVGSTRVYAAPQMGVVRQSYSYVPQATVVEKNHCGPVAPVTVAPQATAPQTLERRYSYEPSVQVNRVYRTNQGGKAIYNNTFRNKALLY